MVTETEGLSVETASVRKLLFYECNKAVGKKNASKSLDSVRRDNYEEDGLVPLIKWEPLMHFMQKSRNTRKEHGPCGIWDG